MNVVALSDRRPAAPTRNEANAAAAGAGVHEMFEYALLAASLFLTVATFLRMA